MTMLQTAQASAPVWRNQRQSGRMAQSGSAVLSGWRPAVRTPVMTESMTPQREPVHWLQAPLAQGELKRKRVSGGLLPSRVAFWTKPLSTTMWSLAKATLPSARTIPNKRAPALQGELGQRMLMGVSRLNGPGR